MADVDALVAELRAGLDKLPKGLWQAETEWPELPSGRVATHIGRCSGENIAAILDALASERSRADRLKKALGRLLSLCEQGGDPFDEPGRPTVLAARAALATSDGGEGE